MEAGHEIRPIETHAERRACLALQHEVWGPDFSEAVPVSLLEVSRRLGGTLIGAWDPTGRLDGFVFGLTGIRDGRPVHWSDMLAVRSGLRDRGLGVTLKKRQREQLLAAGIPVCYWTFDPLESRNAHLNLGRLGAIVREYVVDMYGASDSPLHRGIGTDRFVALWRLDAPRTAARLEGREHPPSLATHEDLPRAFAVEMGERPAPGRPRDLAGLARFLVPIPRDIQALKVAAPELAARWRSATRGVLAEALGRGLQVSELLPGADVSHYLVEDPPEEDGSW